MAKTGVQSLLVEVETGPTHPECGDPVRLRCVVLRWHLFQRRTQSAKRYPIACVGKAILTFGVTVSAGNIEERIEVLVEIPTHIVLRQSLM